jgi:ADP-ribosyl-[dinitrogen reductase] hydrolase
VKLTESQLDRAQGALVTMAAGDALGAPYEFGPPLPIDKVRMRKSGMWELGEWTDDTSMAVVIAEVAAAGHDLRTTGAQDIIVGEWLGWASEAKDVGVQTRRVLGEASRSDNPSLSAASRDAAADLHKRTGRTGGNGSLMRTAPVALAYLGDASALTDAARAISDLTHPDPEAAEACVLWCQATRHAVITGDLKGSAHVGVAYLPEDSRRKWSDRLVKAESMVPGDREFAHNGYVVTALMAAWAAITSTTDGRSYTARALTAAVAGGHDADTVAAIAGALIGAAYGANAVPLPWWRVLHGWPGMDAAGLAELATSVTDAAEV